MIRENCEILYPTKITTHTVSIHKLHLQYSSFLNVQYCYRNYTREKSFCKISFQVGIGLKKVQKQGRGERMQEDYPTSARNMQQMLGSLLAFFNLCLVSVPFSGTSLTEMKFDRNLFPSFCFFWGGGGFKPPSK